MNQINKHSVGRATGLASRGSTLLEVLIALVVILIGLLGLLGLHTKAQQAEFESYQRTHALILMQDMVDRISAHRKQGACLVTTGLSPAYLGVGGAASTACSGGPAQVEANKSAMQWSALLVGAAEKRGTVDVGAMIGARGCIAAAGNAPETYAIAVAWQGLSDTVAVVAPTTSPAGLQSAVACGKDLYGAETRRRVVWTTVSFANLN